MSNYQKGCFTMKWQLSVAIAATLLLAGCSTTDNGSKNASSQQSTNSQSSVSSSSNSSTTKSTASNKSLTNLAFSPTDAIKKFQDKYPKAAITDLSIEKDSGQYQYEITGGHGHSEYTLDLDAKSGAVLDTESETIDIDGEDDNFADNALNLKNMISLNKAVSAAQPKVRHATATEAALKQKGNVTYWEIQFNKGQKQPDVHVDAHSGKVLAVDQDD